MAQISYFVWLLFWATLAGASVSRTPCGNRLQLCSSTAPRDTSAGANVVHTASVADPLKCGRLCLRTPPCETFTFDKGACKLYGESLYLDGTSMLFDSCGECGAGETVLSCSGKTQIGLSCQCPVGYYGDRCQFVATDCDDAHSRGLNPSGDDFTVTWIQPTNSPYAFEVMCYWLFLSTFFLQRSQALNQIDFNQPWQDYKDGFGELDEGYEFWMGLEKLHLMTSSACYKAFFHIDTQSSGPGAAVYTNFKVGNESSNYRLELAYESGLDGLTPTGAFDVTGMQFTTYDRDNDMKSPDNCAVLTSGGWWYRNCVDATPTAIWAPGLSTWPYLKWDALCSSCTITSLTAKLQRC